MSNWDSTILYILASNQILVKIATNNYTAPEQRHHHVDFNLQKPEVIYERTSGADDVPHRHDYFTILVVEKGEGTHVIDYKSYDFTTNQVHFISPGQVHQVKFSSKPKGWVITFSRSFLAINNISEDFISNINLFRRFGENPPLEIDEVTLGRLRRILEEMESCMPLDLHYRNRALGALLQLFLIYCNNSCSIDTEQLDEDNSGVCLMRDFKNLIDKNYKTTHKVADYASDIHISPKHLSSVVKTYTGKTAKDLIQDRITLEAKRLLMHSSLNIKEIAYELGFDEPLHFSGFFKKQTGRSPSIFRKSVK